jgi:uncharacterized protein YrrD
VRIALDTPVWTSDNVEVGRIDGILVNPASGAVHAVVIRHGPRLEHDIEVPAGAVQATDQGSLRLTYPASQLHQLPRFVAETSDPPRPGAVTPNGGPPASNVLWPAGYVPDATSPGQPYRVDQAVRNAMAAMLSEANRAATIVRAGSTVRTRDGEHLGGVEGLAFDEATGLLNGIIIAGGEPPSATRTLPVSVITDGHADAVHVDVGAAEPTHGSRDPAG